VDVQNPSNHERRNRYAVSKGAQLEQTASEKKNRYAARIPVSILLDLPRRPTNLDQVPPDTRINLTLQIPKLANFLAQHLMDSPQYSLLLPNAFERKEFLRFGALLLSLT
jgi:hypothetical protein